MRITALGRTLILWCAILAVHRFAPSQAVELAAIVVVVSVFIDWVRPPNNVNLVALGNLWAALTVAVDVVINHSVAGQLTTFVVIAVSPLLGVRLRRLLRSHA